MSSPANPDTAAPAAPAPRRDSTGTNDPQSRRSSVSQMTGAELRRTIVELREGMREVVRESHATIREERARREAVEKKLAEDEARLISRSWTCVLM
jgi:hypothetical protein